MRASSYTIYVDLPDRSDQILLVHGYTGTFDLVSRDVALYIRSLESGAAPKPLYGAWKSELKAADGPVPPPSDETIQTLRRRGYLTELTQSDERTVLERFAEVLHRRSLERAPTYIVMPTYNCNLRCSYCFQDHMRSDPKFAHLLRTMSPDLIDRMFAAMVRIESLHGLHDKAAFPRRIGFFGGEPFLAVNRPAIERIISTGKDAGPTEFWGVTNGTELEHYEHVLGPSGVANLQITLDGTPEEHDRRRIYPDGSGSFAKIAKNVTMAQARGVGISVRLNIDRNNIGDLPRLVDTIEELGWWNHPRFSVYTAPVRAANPNVESKTTFNSWSLSQALNELRETHPKVERVVRPVDGVRQQARGIFQNPAGAPPMMRESFCSAHNGMYIFDAFGDVYACWEKTGDPEVRIGHIRDDGGIELVQPVLDMWRSRTVATNSACAQCRYAFHCGGGCAVLAEQSTGKFLMNYCDGYASKFRAAVGEAYLEFESGAEMTPVFEAVCDQ